MCLGTVFSVYNRNLLRGNKLVCWNSLKIRRCFHGKVFHILVVISFRILREIEILTESDEPFTSKDILHNTGLVG